MKPDALFPLGVCAGVLLCLLGLGGVALLNWLCWRGKEEEARPLDLSQPPPTPGPHPALWDRVLEDMRERDRVGRERYGVPLQPHNGRDMLKDAYAESLDLLVYLRGAIYERDGE